MFGTASEVVMKYGVAIGQFDRLMIKVHNDMLDSIAGMKATRHWWDEYTAPKPPALHRISYKHFVIRHEGELVHLRCGYPEANRRFKLWQVTRRLTC